VGLFHKKHSKHAVARPHHKMLRGIRSLMRICRFEQMESRQLLSVTPSPIHLGATYLEDANLDDTSSYLKIDGAATTTKVADIIEISFSGGADGTTLDKITINTHGDTFFDTADKGTGDSLPFTLVAEVGCEIDWTRSQKPADGSTTLVLYFKNFHAGDKLVFSIDVDEKGPTAVAEGGEFGIPDLYEGEPDASNKATIEGTFLAPHMKSLDGAAVHFYDTYTFSDSLKEKLPDDLLSLDKPASQKYLPSQCSPGKVFTAGAESLLQQTPLPVTISGYVYYDVNADNVQQSGETGIDGVTLELFILTGGSYVSTGKIVQTKSDGSYQFSGEDLLPGTYRVVETQPTGYLSVGATPGTVDAVTHGSVETENILVGIDLEGGENSIHNDFAETLPAEISGYVYHDADNNGLRYFGEEGIGGVRIVVENIVTHATKETTTNADGSWSIGGLMPGQYKVTESQPTTYTDGLDAAGTVEGIVVGAAHNPGDLIDGVVLVGGQSGIDYDFGELKFARVDGYVYVDSNNNGIRDTGEKPIAGVTVTLLDASGNAISGKTTTTNLSGYYAFENLTPGTYGVRETQPVEPTFPLYYDGLDTVGTVDGVSKGKDYNDQPPGDKLDGIVLGSGKSGLNYNFGELEPAELSGYVYFDANNNGQKDAGETGIGGATVELLDADGKSTGVTRETGADGSYSFDRLKPGVYSVKETQPTRYDDGIDREGSAGGTAVNPGDLIQTITLGSGTKATDYDFGELLTIISGRVFKDGPTIHIKQGDPEPNIAALRDGKFTSDDTPLSGVTMILCDGSGSPLQYEITPDHWVNITTKTAADGTYQFILNDFGLYGGGTYTVRQVRPADYLPGIATAGTNAGSVYNKYAQPTTKEASDWGLIYDPKAGIEGFDPTGTLSAGITHILISAGDNAREYNFSEVVVQRDPGGFPHYDPPPTVDTPLAPPQQPYGEYHFVAMPYSVPQLVIPEMAGGSGGPGGFSWHLSVINAGQPRQMAKGEDFSQYPQHTLFDPESWSGAPVDQGEFILADENGSPLKTIQFGIGGAVPVVGDWSGDGVTEVGVFIDGL
jgi:serine-aspartate repeat-containing protein C/D/E